MKSYLLLVLTCLSTSALANDVVAPINNLFDAMREHNGDKLKAQFTETAQLQRATKDGNVRTNDVAKFAANITQSKAYLDEHLLAVKVQKSGNLASVWTPYAFYLNEKLSHCGVNSFQLIKGASGWKIHYLIDNSHPGDCNAFIKQHSTK